MHPCRISMPLLTKYSLLRQNALSLQESEESVQGAWKTEAALAQMEGWDES